MEKRRMCPHCRAFITTSDAKCPYCGEHVGPKAIDLRDTSSMIAGWIPHARFVTTLLLIINGGLFLATAIQGGLSATNPGVLFFFGAKEGEAIWRQHQWWRLVTAGFLHGGLAHILMNGFVLMDLGAQVEMVYGPARLIVFYVLPSIGGFLLSAWWSPVLSIGASAALFGFIGAMIALGVANPSSAGRAIRGMYMKWAIYGLIYGFIPLFHVDNAAHIGGLATGFVLGYAAGLPVHSTYAREKFWRALAGVCVLITLVSFYMVYLHFPRLYK
jgi:rhomboid protease GluP